MTDIFADVPAFRRDPLSFLTERGNSATEPLIPLALGPDPVFLLADPDYIKPLLKMPEELVDKGPMMAQIREVTGSNILTLSGDGHRERRAVWHGAVGRKAVEPLVPALAAEVRSALADVAESRIFDARLFGINLAMRLLCIVTFGAEVLRPEERNALTESLEVVLSDLREKVFGSELSALELTEISQRLERAKQNLQQIIQRVRERTRGSHAAQALDELQLSDNDLTDEYLVFLIAGHDTTGSAAAWLCHILATVPGLSEAIASEAAAVRNEDGEIDVAKLGSATTTLATVMETLRLYPSGYWFPRGIRQDTEFAGRKLRAGTAIIVSPWLFHHSPRFWETPNEFHLDRNFRSNAYIPFGNGPRVCVGNSFALLELQIIALELASNLALASAGPVGTPQPLVHLWPPSILLEARPLSLHNETVLSYG